MCLHKRSQRERKRERERERERKKEIQWPLDLTSLKKLENFGH